MTTPLITKEQFVKTLDALKEQYDFDKKNTEILGMMFGAEIPGAYNNSLLVHSIMNLLRNYFPKDEDGHCEIEHWAYVLQFGKCGEEYEDAGQLYDRLTKNRLSFSTPKKKAGGLTSKNPCLIDEAGVWAGLYPMPPEDAFLPTETKEERLAGKAFDAKVELGQFFQKTIKDENP